MSGKFLARASAISLAFMLTACGGDESSTPLVDVDTGGGTQAEDKVPSTGEPEAETPTIETPQNPETEAPLSTLALGTGTGNSFSAGSLGIQNSTITSGSTTELNFNIVDTAASNSLAVNVSEPNSIIFTSACLDSGRASIEAPAEVTSGTVLATFNAGTCIGTDVIYAFLNDSSEIYGSNQVDITPTQEVDLALGTLNNNTNAFIPNLISASSTQSLPIGSSVRLSVNIFDQIGQDLQVGQPLTVQFSAQCASDENASSFSQEEVSTTTGSAETIYTVGACPGQTGMQIVYAQLLDQNDVEMAQTSINTEAAKAFQLVAGIPAPQSIAPSFLSQEDRETVSVVRFTLKDSTVSGNGIEGKTIDLSINESSVAEFVKPDGTITDSLLLITDANGQISTTVRAKKDEDQQVFRVIATYDNLESFSMPIAVNSKLPFEPRFSISTTNFAPDAQGKDGVQVELTVLAADDEGNRIRGNTPVNFSTTEGSIDPDCQLDSEGRCTVTWESLAIENFKTTVTATTNGRRADDTVGIISDDIEMLMSDSDGIRIELVRSNPASPSDLSPKSNTYCATASVSLPNGGQTNFSPPTGTEITFEAGEGELINDATGTVTIGSDETLLTAPGFKACTKVRPTSTVENGVTTLSVLLTVTVTPPAETVTPSTKFIQESTEL